MNRPTARSQRQEQGTPHGAAPDIRPTERNQAAVPDGRCMVAFRIATVPVPTCRMPSPPGPLPSPPFHNRRHRRPPTQTSPARFPVRVPGNRTRRPIRRVRRFPDPCQCGTVPCGHGPRTGGLTRGHGIRLGRIRESIPAPVVPHRMPETGLQGVPSRPVHRQPGPNGLYGTRGGTVAHPYPRRRRSRQGRVQRHPHSQPMPTPPSKAGQGHESGFRRDTARTDPLQRRVTRVEPPSPRGP